MISLFVFWELMALASTLLIWSSKNEKSYKAGMRYISIHLLGGVILMCGIVGDVHETQSIAFTNIQLNSVSAWLILCGFLLNAGAPPLTAWLADAYPEASFSGMVSSSGRLFVCMAVRTGLFKSKAIFFRLLDLFLMI